jgi:threonine dehydratase
MITAPMITLQDIQRARERIADLTRVTPCLDSPLLSERCGAEVWLKCETLQVTGSFKPRGAVNRLRTLDNDQARDGVVAASAGNHAQGLAYAAGALGIDSHIVMPVQTPIIKIKRTRAFGAQVELFGDSFDAAYKRALELRDRDQLTFISPFDDEQIVAGQGSIGLELHEQAGELDAVLVPIGGGGMIAGTACALKELRPGIKVIGVQTAAAPAMFESFRSGQLERRTSEPSIADGIAVKAPGEIPLEVIRRYVDDVVLVSEVEIERAIFELLESGKFVTEGAGAAAFAAMLHGRVPELSGKRVGVVLSGANIDLNLLNRIVERSLVLDRRLVRLELLITDRPGALADVLTTVAEAEANVLKVAHNRVFADIHSWQTEVELTLETRDEAHIDQVLERLAGRGFSDIRRVSIQLQSGPTGD